MPADLTLAQVRESGRHAQRDIGDKRWWDYDPDPDVDSLTLNLPLDEEREPFGAYELPWRGWHHATGCDCPYCERRDARPRVHVPRLPSCD